MESYYSSDEEIAWGPRTLREIKGDLKRPVIRKPNRRHTLALNCRLPDSGDKMDESVSHEVNKLNIPGTSTTYLKEGDYEDLITKEINSTEEKPVTSIATTEIIVICEDSDSSVTSVDIEYISSTEGNGFFKKKIDCHANSYNEYDESSFSEDSFEKVVSDEIHQYEVKDDLNSGLNYSMSDDEVVESTPAKTEHNIYNQISTESTPAKNEKSFIPQLQETKEQIPCCNKKVTSNIPKPSSVNKKQHVSPKTNLKVPEHKKITKPTPTKSCPNHLKNIVSPVALYIKSSPMHPLQQNMPQRELSKVVTSTNSKTANKENNSKSEFGHVVYKPSKIQIVSKSAEKHVIPSYTKKLNIRDGQIKKHEAKLRRDFRESTVSEKLLETDLTNCTIDQSLCSDAGDISVLTNKQAFVK